jgi:hypothetical protein
MHPSMHQRYQIEPKYNGLIPLTQNTLTFNIYVIKAKSIIEERKLKTNNIIECKTGKVEEKQCLQKNIITSIVASFLYLQSCHYEFHRSMYQKKHFFQNNRFHSIQHNLFREFHETVRLYLLTSQQYQRS